MPVSLDLLTCPYFIPYTLSLIFILVLELAEFVPSAGPVLVMFSLSRFFFIYTHFSSSITSSQRLSQSSCQKQPNFLSISFDHKSCFVIFILLMSLENFFCCLLSIFTATSKAPTGQRSYFFAVSLSPNTIQACCMWSISMCRPNEMNIFFTYWVFLYNIIYTELGFFFGLKYVKRSYFLGF